jgi:hypothetical protein
VPVSVSGELRDRAEFGHEGLRLLFALMSQELRRLPALTGGRLLPDDERWDFVQEFFAVKGIALTRSLLALGADDGVIGRMCRKSIQHWLIDQTRKVGTGPIRVRLEELLRSDATFAQVPDGIPGAGRWMLTGQSTKPWGGRVDDLVAVAQKITVAAVRWKSTERRPPLASREALAGLMTAVLSTANGSVEIADLTAVFAARFPDAVDPTFIPVDLASEEFLQNSDYASDDDPHEELLAEEASLDAAGRAVEVYSQLENWERRVLPVLADIDAVMELLGCRRSVAYERVGRLKNTLGTLIDSGEDYSTIVDEVIVLCQE